MMVFRLSAATPMPLLAFRCSGEAPQRLEPSGVGGAIRVKGNSVAAR
jgi:hypothetical protein